MRPALIPTVTSAAFAMQETHGSAAFTREMSPTLNETLRRRGVPGVVMGDGSLFKFVMTAEPPRTYRDTVDPGAEDRLQRLFVHLLDDGVLVNGNGLACLSTPMGEREIDEIVEATDRAAARLAVEGQ